MSRTYRSGYQWKYVANGHAYTYEELRKLFPNRGLRDITWSWTGAGFRTKKLRDGNNEMMTSPPKWFKRLNRRAERRRQDAAIRDGREMPRFKTRDRWEWW